MLRYSIKVVNLEEKNPQIYKKKTLNRLRLLKVREKKKTFCEFKVTNFEKKIMVLLNTTKAGYADTD